MRLHIGMESLLSYGGILIEELTANAPYYNSRSHSGNE